MKYRTTIIALMTVLVFFSTNVFAAQYENYEWGISKQEAIKQIKDMGMNLLANMTLEKDGVEGLGYSDTLFNENILVYLQFTPKSKILCAISIKSEDASLGKDLKPILTKKYGVPMRQNQFLEKYIWAKDGHVSLLLTFDFKTTLIYYSTKYFHIYKEEDEEIKTKEAEGKL